MTENGTINEGKKKRKKVRTINTSVSAENLIYELVVAVCNAHSNLSGFIPTVMSGEIGRGHFKRAIKEHRKNIKNMSGFAIYGLKDETLKMVRQLKDEEKMNRRIDIPWGRQKPSQVSGISGHPKRPFYYVELLRYISRAYWKNLKICFALCSKNIVVQRLIHQTSLLRDAYTLATGSICDATYNKSHIFNIVR